MPTIECCRQGGELVYVPSRTNAIIHFTTPECAYLDWEFSANWVGNGWRGQVGNYMVGCYCQGSGPGGPEFEMDWEVTGCGGGSADVQNAYLPSLTLLGTGCGSI